MFCRLYQHALKLKSCVKTVKWRAQQIDRIIVKGLVDSVCTAAMLHSLLITTIAHQQEAAAYLQPFGDLPDRVLNNFPSTQASVPQLVAHLASEPVWICCPEGVEIKSCFGIDTNTQIVIHSLVFSLQDSSESRWCDDQQSLHAHAKP